MLKFFVKIVSVVILLYIQRMVTVKEHLENKVKKTVMNDTPWNFAKYFQMMLEKYEEMFSKKLLSYLYVIYAHLTIANIIIFFFKYVSTTIFMYRHLRSYYITSRDRLTRKQLEYEDIILQTRIVTTKISVREAEYAEWSDNLRKSLDRLRKVRTRVRELIADNEELKHVFDSVPKNLILDGQKGPEQEQEFILELMRELKYEHTALSEIHGDNLDSREHASPESPSPAASVYTSVSDCQKDCHVKIVKVTNVYKVSYLRNFMKQKRQRRASKHALLKKKMEDTKKLIEDWQRTLNAVINSKLAMLNADDNRIEMASQKAMGDYKPPQREYSDSDSELSWNHNSFRNYPYYEEPGMSGEYFAPREYADAVYQPASMQCEEDGRQMDAKLPNKLFVITEATSSQLAIEEAKSDDDDWDNQEIVSM